jgi:hypothetical protein
MRFTERIRQAWDDLTQSRFEKHLMRELAIAQGKVERMEIAIMPLASPAGAAYVKSTKPIVVGFGKEKLDHFMVQTSNSWASIQAENERELAEEEKTDVDGVRQERAAKQ